MAGIMGRGLWGKRGADLHSSGLQGRWPNFEGGAGRKTERPGRLWEDTWTSFKGKTKATWRRPQGVSQAGARQAQGWGRAGCEGTRARLRSDPPRPALLFLQLQEPPLL